MRFDRLTCFAFAILGLAAAGMSCRNAASRGATASETRQVFKTYPFSEPDPVPIFARSTIWGHGARLYPYFFFNTFSAAAEDREWTVVRLENPYVSVDVLPQVGGKVWGAADKTTGRDFLYRNHVLKFREIALRGPWTSGGIEFNFGLVGHAPTTATPVDYFVREDEDGASVIVGAMDLPSRTRWSVTVRLPKDKAYFETNGAWYNPTPFRQSYYYWSCAAIKTAEDLKYVFPGRWQIGHDYNVPLEPWPVDAQGRDLAWYKNNASPGSKSYFTVGEREDFYGAWYAGNDAGFGHWALYDDMPGRKVWIWDLSRAGEIWVDLLTDADGQYTEPQAGRLLNQSDHEFFTPGAADRWREIWFPYDGIGPLVKASPAAVLGAEASAGTLRLGLAALEPLDDDLVVASGGRELFRERVRLEPGAAFKKDLPYDPAGGPFTVRLGGKLVYRSDPAADDIGRPLRFRPVDESSVEGLFLSATRLEKARSYDQALEKYLACLAKAPAHLGALTRTAELYARRGEYDQGLAFAGKALEIDMYDPGANFIYGTLARRTGRLVDAKETLGWAARSLEYRSGAYAALSEIALVEKDYDLAGEYGRRAVDYNKYNVGAYETQAVALRKAGKTAAAKRFIEADLLRIDPLDHLARFELYLLEPTAKNLDAFRSMIRNELPHESFLEMALSYLRWNCDGDAVEVLKQAPEYPTVFYMLSRLTTSSPEESLSYLEKASALSPAFAFPFREDEIPLFEWAAAARPGDWKPKYYLGLIFWAKGRIHEAEELFAQCDAADFAPLFLSRAMLHRDADPARAVADYERAVALDPKAWRAWHLLVEFQTSRNERDAALSSARKAAEIFPKETPVKIDLVKALLNAGRFDEAAAVLDTIEALPFEGASEIHALFVRTHVQLGLGKLMARDWAGAVRELDRSKGYPEKLGTGKPFDPDFRIQDYLLGLAYGKLGEKDKAEAAFQAVIEYTLKYPEARGPGAYIGALALRRAGKADRAAAAMKMSSPPPQDVLEALKIR
jgi:tetratricopeptide (TPR) repeat protein